ncbi:MAG: F0F1 ATP synthase subunit B [Candidatus Spyradocola sp.]
MLEGIFEIVSPLSLVMHLINLIILYIVFKIFLYKPVAKYMKQRSERIAAERAQLDADKAEVASVRERSNDIIKQARADAEDQVAQMLVQADIDAKAIRSQAEKQAGEILDNARAEAELEKKRQLDALHEQVLSLSVQLASRILEREVKPEDHQKLMEEFLAEVK